jgi:hypothetical protein
MLYQRKTLPNTDIGSPGPLPSFLAGLSNDKLANLSAALSADICAALGFTGQGFFPVNPPSPPDVPTMVSRLQAKMALNNAGLLPAVEAAVAAGSEATKIYWTEAADFHRTHPTLLAMTLDLPPGLNGDDTIYGAEGRWASCSWSDSAMGRPQVDRRLGKPDVDPAHRRLPRRLPLDRQLGGHEHRVRHPLEAPGLEGRRPLRHHAIRPADAAWDRPAHHGQRNLGVVTVTHTAHGYTTGSA